MPTKKANAEVAISLDKSRILADFRRPWESRHASLTGRKEVFMGKAKFGIFGDGKELPQLAMASVFEGGDFRSGYYRDQTFMFAIGELTLQQFFAQLYAHADDVADPATAGRQMNAHFSTTLLNQDGSWRNLSQLKNSAADLSPTAGQMPRLVGLGYASKLFRQNPDLHAFTQFSQQGREIAFGTIGNASSSEGLFWESMNAAGVLQIPLLMSVWDDGYGISVPQEYHTVKESISEALAGFQRKSPNERAFEIFTVKAWDYPALLETYQRAARLCREQHVPCLVHVIEVTQQQGHSTSGSHERYKSKERLAWEREFDCNAQFRHWILSNGYATAAELDQIEEEAKQTVNTARTAAWQAYTDSVKIWVDTAVQQLHHAGVADLASELEKTLNPGKADAVRIVKKALRKPITARQGLIDWLRDMQAHAHDAYNSYLYNDTPSSPLHAPIVPAEYASDAPIVDGREVVQANFDAILAQNPLFFALGEDVGRIGDVNQGFAGLQEKYGELRVTDTSIREASIVGQGIGAAMRGLRPLVEIQYLDYIYYALQILSDDVASLSYRTKGKQKCPLIVRTRGHRLEGIWHSGSPIGTLLHSLRGMHLLVPRNMTQAAGFYNTLLWGDEPAVVIECLNGYRLKERMPANVGQYTLPLGVPEVLREGDDVTIVTYGSMCRVVMEAAEQLAETGIGCEVIDVQTLLPFDRHHRIIQSIRKTNRVIFADEDVRGGATAYMMQQVVEGQEAYRWLDAAPLTITAEDHRPPYGSDGDYFSKPNPETIFDAVYAIMREAEPARFPELY